MYAPATAAAAAVIGFRGTQLGAVNKRYGTIAIARIVPIPATASVPVLGENGMEKKNRPLRTGSLYIHIGRRVRRKNGSPDRFQQGTAHCTAYYVHV